MTQEAAEQRPQRPSQLDMMVDDLTRRVASLSLEASQWRARALDAEASLRELAEQEEAEQDEAQEEQ